MARKTTSTPDEPAGYELNQDSFSGSKGRPTPTRREKEEARKRPLVVSDRTEARKQARLTMQLERDKQRIGMANGDEKYLPARDRGPQKKFVRDYVDARTSIGEFLIPLMFIVIILTMFPADSIIPFVGIIVLWVFFAAAVIDVLILGAAIRKKLGAKFGETKVEGGVRWYAAMRALQLRIMRLPKPQVKRGNYPA